MCIYVYVNASQQTNERNCAIQYLHNKSFLSGKENMGKLKPHKANRGEVNGAEDRRV